MRRHAWSRIRLLTAFGLTLAMADLSVAQVAPGPGGRAAGMAGAFVAVADDATAIYWNPAGLATGPFFSAVADWTTHESGPGTAGARAGGAWRGRPWFLGAATLPLGLAYYELGATTTHAEASDGTRRATVLETRQFAATLVQSIVPELTVAASLRVVRGLAADGPLPGLPSQSLDRASELERRGRTAFDLDVGVLAEIGPWRLGLVARNLTAPDFTAPSGTRLGMDRTVRVGVAGRPADGVTVAFDADLTRVAQGPTERRDAAIGVEWTAISDRLALRGGGRFSTVGDVRPVAAGGVSVGLAPGFWIDVHGARGGSAADRSWGLAGRIGF